jgi:hypothetical protein
MTTKMVAIYHLVRPAERIDESTKTLVALVRKAQKENPGKPRWLYLDIDGHRDGAEGFDSQMVELRALLRKLLPYLAGSSSPLLGDCHNPSAQRDDIPTTLGSASRRSSN